MQIYIHISVYIPDTYSVYICVYIYTIIGLNERFFAADWITWKYFVWNFAADWITQKYLSKYIYISLCI